MIVPLIQFNHSTVFKDLKEDKEDKKQDLEWHEVDGLSFESEYLPIYSLAVNKGIYNKKVVHYGIPTGSNKELKMTDPLKSYKTLYQGLIRGSFPRAFKTKVGAEPLYIMKGTIYEFVDGKLHILFMTCLKSEYLLQAFGDVRINRTDYSKFAIFISTKFTTDPTYKTLYRKLYNEVMLNHLKLGVEVIITNDIAKRCFKNNLKLPSFKTIEEMKNYLYAFNKKLKNE